jgi:hypothetical protein
MDQQPPHPETPEEKAARKAAKAARKAKERLPQRTHPWSDFQHQSCGWLNFPLFGVAIGPSPYDENEFVVVAVGGGGSSKSGVPNGIFMTTVSQHHPNTATARFGHTSEQFIDKGSVLPFAVSLSSLELNLAAITIGPMVHIHTFNPDRSIGLEELTAFKADFCVDKPADVHHVQFTNHHIVTAGAERIIRVWTIAVDKNPCSIELMAEFQ